MTDLNQSSFEETIKLELEVLRLTAQLEASMRLQESLASNVNEGLLTIRDLQQQFEQVTAERDKQAQMYRSQVDYGVKLQQLIENLKYETSTPSPELYHHKIIIEFKQQLATAREQIERLEREKEDIGESHASMLKYFTAVRIAAGGDSDTMEEAVTRVAQLRAQRTQMGLNQIIDGVCAHVNAECENGCGTKARHLLWAALGKVE